MSGAPFSSVAIRPATEKEGATEFAFVGLLCWMMLALTTVVIAVDARPRNRERLDGRALDLEGLGTPARRT